MGRVVEKADIAQLLSRYTAAEARIAANLLELDDHPTFALVTSGVLTGETAHRLIGAAGAAPSMWMLLDALRVHLDSARDLALEKSTPERREALEHLLTGPSVLIETIDTPLAERDLLDAESTERRVTVDQVIDELRAAYDPIRDGIAEIDEVWRDVLPRASAAETTLGELAAEARELGVTEALVTMAQHQLDQVRATVMDDPLGLDANAGAELDEAVAEAAHRVGTLRQGHDELSEDFARTEALVATARSLRERAAAAYAEANAKIRDASGLLRAPARSLVDSLAADAARLRSGSDEWQQQRHELDSWLGRAGRLVAQLDRVQARNQEPLDRRSQLRGLLAAYRAKAASLGHIENVDIADLVDDIHSELYTAPTDLDRAQRGLATLAEDITRLSDVEP